MLEVLPALLKGLQVAMTRKLRLVRPWLRRSLVTAAS
jgi:hypothetical protein